MSTIYNQLQKSNHNQLHSDRSKPVWDGGKSNEFDQHFVSLGVYGKKIFSGYAIFVMDDFGNSIPVCFSDFVDSFIDFRH